jgi:hypothetical protein
LGLLFPIYGKTMKNNPNVPNHQPGNLYSFLIVYPDVSVVITINGAPPGTHKD